MQCILCGQESAYHRVITTAWINGLPQAFQMQTKDSIVGKVACRPCYRLGEQIVQKLKALRESLGVLKDITGIALDATVRGQETELLDQVPPQPIFDAASQRAFFNSIRRRPRPYYLRPYEGIYHVRVTRNRGACQHRGRRPLGR